MMTWQEFAEQLRRTGEYKTPNPPDRSVVDRIMGRFDWWYHLLISRRVWTCGAVAKRGGLDDVGWAEKSFEVIHCIERCGGTTHIEIPELARACWPCVYVANHMSVLETIILPGIIIPFGHPTIVVKDSLLRYPALRQTLRRVGPITVSRTDPRKDLKKVLRQGRESIEKGNSILLFPQSTRNPVFDPGAVNSLGVKLASRCGVPVVPLALKTDFSGLGLIVKEFGRIDRTRPVRFRFGDPIDPSGDSKAAHKEVVDFIGDSLLEWGGTVLP